MAESGDRQLFITCCKPAPATLCPTNLIRCKTLLERYQRPQTGAGGSSVPGTRKHDNSYPAEARHSPSASSVWLQSDSCVAAGADNAINPKVGKGTRKPHSKDADPANRGHPNASWCWTEQAQGHGKLSHRHPNASW